MPRPGRQTTERAKDFKGTLLQLVKAMSTYKISLIVVIVFAILSTVIFRPQHKGGKACGHLLLDQLGILVVGEIARFHERRHTDRQTSDLPGPQYLESM